jgi:hypothetical protein
VEYIRIIRGVIPCYLDKEECSTFSKDTIAKKAVEFFIREKIILSCDKIVSVYAYEVKEKGTRNGIFIQSYENLI